MVDTWALKGFLYPYFVVYVSTAMILGPCGHGNIPYPDIIIPYSRYGIWNLPNLVISATWYVDHKPF